MPAPTSYTEDDLATFMLAELGDIGQDLLISTRPDPIKGDLGDLTEPVNDALLDYGTEDISTIAGTQNIQGLRALASVHAWRLALKRAAARYDQADGTQNLKRSQVFPAVKKQLDIAEGIATALGYGASGGKMIIKVGNVRYTQDPYLPIDESPTGLPSSDVILP